MSYLYLGQPYSAPSHLKPLEDIRYRLGSYATAVGLVSGKSIYAPIVHCHDLAQKYNLPGHADFWKRYNFDMLTSSVGLVILPLSGWKNSKGLKHEIKLAKKLYIPITILDLEKLLTQGQWHETQAEGLDKVLSGVH